MLNSSSQERLVFHLITHKTIGLTHRQIVLCIWIYLCKASDVFVLYEKANKTQGSSILFDLKICLNVCPFLFLIRKKIKPTSLKNRGQKASPQGFFCVLIIYACLFIYLPICLINPYCILLLYCYITQFFFILHLLPPGCDMYCM